MPLESATWHDAFSHHLSFAIDTNQDVLAGVLFQDVEDGFLRASVVFGFDRDHVVALGRTSHVEWYLHEEQEKKSDAPERTDLVYLV